MFHRNYSRLENDAGKDYAERLIDTASEPSNSRMCNQRHGQSLLNRTADTIEGRRQHCFSVWKPLIREIEAEVIDSLA